MQGKHSLETAIKTRKDHVNFSLFHINFLVTHRIYIAVEMSSKIFEDSEEDFKTLVDDIRTRILPQASKTFGGRDSFTFALYANLSRIS